eukprot:331073-Chlamydomonas_euryale.AAC.1
MTERRVDGLHPGHRRHMQCRQPCRRGGAAAPHCGHAGGGRGRGRRHRRRTALPAGERATRLPARGEALYAHDGCVEGPGHGLDDACGLLAAWIPERVKFVCECGWQNVCSLDSSL